MDTGKFLLLPPPPPTEYGSRKMSATTPPPPTESILAKIGLSPQMDVGPYAYGNIHAYMISPRMPVVRMRHIIIRTPLGDTLRCGQSQNNIINNIEGSWSTFASGFTFKRKCVIAAWLECFQEKQRWRRNEQ